MSDMNKLWMLLLLHKITLRVKCDEERLKHDDDDELHFVATNSVAIMQMHICVMID